MSQQDTVKLLRQCDAGVDMGIASIDEVLKYVCSENFLKLLQDCKAQHEMLRGQIKTELDKLGDCGKSPCPLAKGMSWVKTNVSLAVDESDKTIADLITDGCNMGVKSLNRYLNQYSQAREEAKNLARRLCDLEEQLVINIRGYL